MKKTIFFSLVVIFIYSCQKEPAYKYFGQTPPGNTPELFAPGIISFDGRNESMITFSPDGKECNFTVHHEAWNWCNIQQSVYSDTGWTSFEKAPFSNDYSMCPSISTDGSKLFLASYRDSAMSVFECFRTNENGWSAPKKMNKEISSASMEYSCHPSSLGSMFVCSWRAGGVGGCDGWRIPFKNGKYQKAENLGYLNTIVGDCIWAPGPEEEFLIFQSRRPASSNRGGFFETDLFITFAMADGEWSAPKNLGSKINSDSTDGFAWVSHDGEYLFFSSDRRGTFDIYWVSLDSIIKNTPREPLVALNHKPGGLEYYQYYQNKTDSITTIYFDLEKGGNTKLTICDRANQELQTVLNEYRQAGKNDFVWAGDEFARGEYLCKMQVSDSLSGEIFLESTIQVLLR